MNFVNKILSILLAFVFISSNFHIIESENFTKAGDYSLCAVDCEHNEHSSVHDDCDICTNKVRKTISGSTKELFIPDNKNLIIDSICIITSDKSFGLFLSRAPPLNIS
ncbi:MAG: hypothetical protein HOM22_00660 [Candidatus Marinimicrobia bacterium]|nr:hypothetical protein [Candidatus Neomarinimicrobiota bacterium]